MRAIHQSASNRLPYILSNHVVAFKSIPGARFQYHSLSLFLHSTRHFFKALICVSLLIVSRPISKYGLQHDREWMIYSPKTMRFICQRQVPAICLITATLNGDSICLSAPGMDKISIPFTEMSDDNRLENVVLWKDKVNGVDQGDVAAEWLTRYVNKGREYRLMRISGDQGVYSRPTAPKYTPSELRGKSHASYADGFPYLGMLTIFLLIMWLSVIMSPRNNDIL